MRALRLSDTGTKFCYVLCRIELRAQDLISFCLLEGFHFSNGREEGFVRVLAKLP